MKEDKYTQENMEFMIKHIDVIDEELHKHWKDTKLIILFYNQGIEPEGFNNIMERKSIKNGYEVYDTKDLTGIFLTGEYTIGDQWLHQNTKAYTLISDKLSEKLKL